MKKGIPWSIQMRQDVNTGIQYRVGQYSDDESGWTTIYDVTDLRGTLVLPVVMWKVHSSLTGKTLRLVQA